MDVLRKGRAFGRGKKERQGLVSTVITDQDFRWILSKCVFVMMDHCIDYR
jgi:hypothetical protein